MVRQLPKNYKITVGKKKRLGRNHAIQQISVVRRNNKKMTYKQAKDISKFLVDVVGEKLNMPEYEYRINGMNILGDQAVNKDVELYKPIKDYNQQNIDEAFDDYNNFVDEYLSHKVKKTNKFKNFYTLTLTIKKILN